MEAKFKKGDRIVMVGNGVIDIGEYYGDIGIIERVEEQRVYIDWEIGEDKGKCYWCWDNEIEKIGEEKNDYM